MLTIGFNFVTAGFFLRERGTIVNKFDSDGRKEDVGASYLKRCSLILWARGWDTISKCCEIG